MRRIFVGDIQGCLDPLERLLEQVEFRSGADVLFPVGDLVRKGPDSSGVLRLLEEIDAQPVLGNHDLRYLARGEASAAEESWLRGLPVVRVLDDIIVVHAGLHPSWDEDELATHVWTEDDIDFAVTVRYCDAEGRRPESSHPPPGPPFEPWHHFYRGRRRVVFGHWARKGLQQTERVLGLDTGCVYGRELTAWIAEEDRLVSVPGLQ